MRKRISTAKTNEETFVRESALIKGYNDDLGEYIKMEEPLSRNRVRCFFFNEYDFTSFLNKNFDTTNTDFKEYIDEHFEKILEKALEVLDHIVTEEVSNEAKNNMVLAYGCSCHSGGYSGHCGTSSSSSTGCHSGSSSGGHCSVSSSSSVSCHSGGHRGHC